VVHRLLVQYGRPTDPAEFDQHYRDVHVGLAEAVTMASFDVDDVSPAG
jgi:hypothetical protein